MAYEDQYSFRDEYLGGKMLEQDETEEQRRKRYEAEYDMRL